MITATLNQADKDRILSKLNAALAKSTSHPFKWRIKLLDQYTDQVFEAMGTISARGGYPHINFDSASGYVKWKSLRPYTLRAKLAHRGTPKSEYAKMNPGELYSRYASELTIWEDTGETKGSVKRTGNFAGILSGPLEKANTVEFGDPDRKIPSRSLFRVANFAIITTIHNMLADDNSWLAKAMRREFCSLVSGWGS